MKLHNKKNREKKCAKKIYNSVIKELEMSIKYNKQLEDLKLKNRNNILEYNFILVTVWNLPI